MTMTALEKVKDANLFYRRERTKYFNNKFNTHRNERAKVEADKTDLLVLHCFIYINMSNVTTHTLTDDSLLFLLIFLLMTPLLFLLLLLLLFLLLLLPLLVLQDILIYASIHH